MRIAFRSCIPSASLILRASVVVAATVANVTSSISQDFPRDAFDPPPPMEVTLHRPETVLSTSLENYGVGEATHPHLVDFAREVEGQIELFSQEHKSLLVVITGAADGIPNRGLTLPLASYPWRCRQAVTNPIDDQELALLRGCLLEEMISSLYPGALPPAIVFESRIDDAPDGGPIGGQYRAAFVEVNVK